MRYELARSQDMYQQFEGSFDDIGTTFPMCCMQDTFTRARTRPKGYAAARPSARATIGYLVYKPM